jgi:hypothetical protein
MPRPGPASGDLLEVAVSHALRASASIGEIVARLRGDPRWYQVGAHQVRAAVLALEREGILTRNFRDGVAVFRAREATQPRTAVHGDLVSASPRSRRNRSRKRRRAQRSQ